VFLEVEGKMTGFGIFAAFAALALLLLTFWLGARFGGRHTERELRAERSHSIVLQKQRDEARTNLERAQKNVRKLGLEPRKVFPWLACLLFLAAWPMQAAAQTPAAAPPIGTSYSPEENLEGLDVAAIASASSSIDLAAHSLTDPFVIGELAAQAKAGIKVRIYLDRGELQAECREDVTCARVQLSRLIGLPGVEIRVKLSKVLMHLKSYQVDGGLVRDGSANFSEQGERSQDNSATWSTNPSIAAAFRAKFDGMWNRPGNLTVAQAVGSK
jgi:phosphatidylserine/phosphatidylglycerophosphate/cardiolipin synthase-like enzyme